MVASTSREGGNGISSGGINNGGSMIGKMMMATSGVVSLGGDGNGGWW